MQTFPITIPDEAATLASGEAIGRMLAGLPTARAQLHVNLVGDLGAGKTTLVRGVLRGLGYTGRVKSPTYPLLESYRIGNLNLEHFDLYRLESPEAFSEAGFEDYFVGTGLRFVEWPDRAGNRMPTPDWCVTLRDAPEGVRLLSIDAQTPPGIALLERLGS